MRKSTCYAKPLSYKGTLDNKEKRFFPHQSQMLFSWWIETEKGSDSGSVNKEI